MASSLLPLIIFFCIAFSTIPSTSADIFGNETDRLSLLAFKAGITRDPFRIMSSWNSTISFCNWEGVTCSKRYHRVIALDLKSKTLMGSISPHIGNLTFLRSINLQNNSLQGKLPQEVGRLRRLQEFRVNNNSISEQIPVSLSNCSSLINLTLSYNKLVGELPMELGSLSKLVVFKIYYNQLTGRIPESFGNLSSLKILVLGRNNLEGTIPQSLGQLARLEFFSIGLNNLSGMIPPLLYNISSLQTFSIPLNQLDGSIPSKFDLNLFNLRKFFVGGNKLSGSIPASFITNISGLQMLDLSFNHFNGKVPVELGLLENLEKVILNGNTLGSGKTDDLDFITPLSNCSKLRVLSMALNHLGGTLPRSITNFSNTVKEIYLEGNQISGTIPSAISNLNNLMGLGLQVNLLTGEIPENIGTLQKLQILSLAENKFLGQIPNSIGNISHLYSLDISNNRLEGNLSSLEKCQSLQTLNLSYNNLNGIIPEQLLLALSRGLTIIILAHNSLMGSLPPEVGTLKNLLTLDISENKLSGKIPSQLGSCLSLEKLYLQGNFFQGVVPSSVSSLKILQRLDLSKNNLSGKMPDVLGELPILKFLNLSFNHFEGEIPITGVFQNASAFSIVGNDKLCGGIPGLGLRKCHIEKSNEQGVSLALKMTLGLVTPLLLITSLFLILYWTKKHRGSKQVLESEWFSRTRLKTISYSDLWKATNRFSSENLIGSGSFGSVYKGVLHQGEKPIAVKVIDLVQRSSSKSFMNECEVLRNVRHRNLLKIITVCSSTDTTGNDFKALVFEFMPNGSVESWLHPSSDREDLSGSLNLLQRVNIAIDVASALDYLHNQCKTPIVHCDVKPSNILLDDDMVANVADFGLAKFLLRVTSNISTNDPTSSSASLVGTVGYIPPEYGTGAEVSTQGDVYSYGMFLLEMFTGKRPTDEQYMDGLNLHQFCKMALTRKVMDIIDPHLPFGEHFCRMDKIIACLISMIQVGVACSSVPITERPRIRDVLVEMIKTKEAILVTGVHGAMEDFVW